MANYTTNYNLEKPLSTEYYDIEVFNSNADIVDGALKTITDNVSLKANKTEEKTATLTGTGWTGSGPYTQTVSVSGVTAADKPIIDVVLSSGTETAIAELEAWGLVNKIETGAGSITATCLEEQPEVDLNLQIKVVG